MSMSIHCIGFKPADDKWKKMKAVWDACHEARVKLPDEVDNFFEFDQPDEAGVRVDEETLVDCGALSDWEDEDANGFELDVSKLPEDVTIIRVYSF